ncbi:MAG: pyridoxal-5'-phosphate-dependent protein subunit beta, partial [Planctomycetales bacterium 12-60-4]
ILKRHVRLAVTVPDLAIQQSMRWMYERHGLRTEPSGVITIAAALSGAVDLRDGDGDVVFVLSGRNVDEDAFRRWIDVPGFGS